MEVTKRRTKQDFAQAMKDLVEVHFPYAPHTPKHGSWLNMAEIELSVLGRRCLDQRLPTMERVNTLITPWQQGRNEHHVTIQ